MLARDEIARSLTGAWELFLDRPGAVRRFDVSIDGFWRSFAAVVLVIPSYAFAVLADERMAAAVDLAATAQGGAAMAIEKGLALAVDWVALPLILAALARPLGIGRHYATFVIARNWCAVIAAVPFGAVGLLMAIGLVGADLGSVLMFAALVAVLRYNYLVARRALEASLGFAIGIVILDFAVSLTIALALGSAFAAQ